jgi:hypothetical protein
MFVRRIVWAGGLAAAMLTGATAAVAQPGPAAAVDAVQSQALTNQLEASLSKVGCSSSAADDIDVIQSVIAKSGAQPTTAQQALKMLRVWPRLCGDQALAALTVEQSVTVALEDSQAPSAGDIGGPPINGPPTYLPSAGASDYVAP